MKKLFAILSLACGLALGLNGKETVVLKTEPEQTLLLAGSSQEVVIKIDLSAATPVKTRRTPLNIAVVLDRSGSMAGAKIEKARQAAMLVVDQLTRDDVFALIAYDSVVEVVVPAQMATDKNLIKRQIARIEPRGSTALYAGVQRGADELKEHFSKKRINRVILLSDGLANVGPSKPAQLRELGRQLARDGVSVSTIGVGDDYNENLMAGLAEASDANFYYVKDTEKLPEIFARELGSLLTVAAREIRIEVICPENVRPLGFIGRSEKFEGGRAVVRLNNLAAGQNRSLLLRCEASQPYQVKGAEIADVQLSYLDELEDGREQSVRETARVGFTSDGKAVQASVNASVAAQREWMLNAVKKDEALAAADAGQYEHAAGQFLDQATHLERQCGNAPPGLRVEFENEARNLRQRAQELQQGQYGSGARKALQNEAWSVRNSK